MPRRKKFVDLPVTPSTRDKVKKRKGKRSYDEFINDVLGFEF